MKKKTYLESRIQSFRYAIAGLSYMLKDERNAQIHTFVTIIVLALGVALKISNTEWCIIIIVSGLVFASEAFNSSIERLVDKVTPEFNEMAKNIKDLAAGGVLISALAAAVTGILIFLPKMINLFR